MSTTPMDAKARAQAFAKEHLQACCHELQVWWSTGLLPEDGKMEELELICLPLDPQNATRMAEQFVVAEAVKVQALSHAHAA